MHRRQFLRLGAVASGVVALGGLAAGRRVAAQSPTAVPTVDRLILTNVVDNVYDVFARGSAKLDTITVQRTPLGRGGTFSPSMAWPITWSRCAGRSAGRSCSISPSPS